MARKPLALVLVLLALGAGFACGGGRRLFGHEHEYQEDVHVALDGSARVYVNASAAALVALRGAGLPTDPTARIERSRVEKVFASPVARVASVSFFRRHGRRFMSVRLEVDDIRQLHRAPMLAWSAYGLEHRDEQVIYTQQVSASANQPVGDVGWTGDEWVAYRLHLPAKIEWHPREIPVQRGNILEWEQPLKDRLAGVPIAMEVRMQPQTILYRTLWLFGISALLAVAALAAVVWWVFRR